MPGVSRRNQPHARAVWGSGTTWGWYDACETCGVGPGVACRKRRGGEGRYTRMYGKPGTDAVLRKPHPGRPRRGKTPPAAPTTR